MQVYILTEFSTVLLPIFNKSHENLEFFHTAVSLLCIGPFIFSLVADVTYNIIIKVYVLV